MYLKIYLLIVLSLILAAYLWRKGWRPFIDLHPAKDQFAGDDIFTRGTIRLMINTFCVAGLGIQPPHHASGGSVFLILFNVPFGFWCDPDVRQE